MFSSLGAMNWALPDARFQVYQEFQVFQVFQTSLSRSGSLFQEFQVFQVFQQGL